MTTIPSRIDLLEPALESLWHQSRQADRLILSVPEDSDREDDRYVIPEFLTDGRFPDSWLTLARPPQDFGPGTKLLGALPHLDGDELVVLADDDVRYAPTFLDGLVIEHEARPGEAHSYYTYRAWGLAIGQGCDGFAFPAAQVDGIHEWIDPHLDVPAIRHHDDVWISFFLRRRGTRIRQATLPDSTGDLVYEQVHEVNSLLALEGELERHELTRLSVAYLMAEGEPTIGMRLSHLAEKLVGRWVRRGVGAARRRLPPLRRRQDV